MSMVLDRAQVNEEKKQFQHIVEDITGILPAVHWRYSAHSNERFPLERCDDVPHDGLAVVVEDLSRRKLLDVLEVPWGCSRDDLVACSDGELNGIAANAR